VGRRKPLLFAAVFGTGVLVLVLLKQGPVVRQPGETQRAVTDEGALAEPATRAEDANISGESEHPAAGRQGGSAAGAGIAEQGSASVEFKGRLEYTQFSAEERGGRRPKLFHFLAGHVQPLGGSLYIVENLFVELFEPESGTVRATVRSPRSEMPIRLAGGRREFGAEDTVELTAVDSEIFDGLPLVPARFEAQELTVALADAIYTTPGEVRFTGQGARASGRDFLMDQGSGLVRFGRDGVIAFASELLPPTTLAATGAGVLSLEQAPGGEGQEVRVLVEGGARLEASGEMGFVATAERIEFSGAPRGAGEFSPSAAQASGDVVIDAGGGRFAGERARFVFDAEGRLQVTVLEGEPTARVPILVEGGEVVQVELEATESVHLFTDTGFSVKGPCTVRISDRDLLLECNGQLLGAGGQEAGFGWISASGGVRASFGVHEFVGEDLDLRSFVGPDGEVEWTLHTSSAALLVGELAAGDGSTYRASFGGGLEFTTAGEELVIQRATEVDLAVEGARAFHLLAGELMEASLTERSFEARGGVRFEDAQTIAQALEASAVAGGALKLTGSMEAPVVLDLSRGGLLRGGELLAREVRTAPGELIALGGVRAELDTGAGVLDIEAEVLEVSFLADEDGAPLPGPALFSLREVERCRLVTEEESISWSADATEFSLFASAPGEREGSDTSEEPGAPGAGAEGRGDAPAEGARAGVEGEEVTALQGDGPRSGGLELRAAVATGGVLLERQQGGSLFAASGERMVFTANGESSLEGADGSFVRLSGVFPGGERYGRVIARGVRFVDGHMIARGATIAYEGGAEAPLVVRRISADHIDAGAQQVDLVGGVHVEGDSPATGSWTLRASAARLTEGGEVEAWDGFDWSGEEGQHATGRTLAVTPETIRMAGEPARLSFAGLEWEADELELNRARMMLSAGKGRVRSTTDHSIELSYDGIHPIEGEDATILGLRRPRFVRGETVARAEWALLWVDRNQAASANIPAGPPADTPPSLFGRVDAQGFSSALDEIYIEGHVEVTEAGVRRAEVEAIYLDLVDGRGWLKGARLTIPVKLSGELVDLAVDAEWLRHSADGSLTANSARITTCDHVDPHYFIRTKDLRLKPSAEEGVRWDISVRSNALVFGDGLAIPLPALEYEADKTGSPLIDRLVLGDTARFGTVLQATVDGELGVIERAAAFVTGSEPEDIFGGVSYRASWLGERGLMLGIGARIEADDEFWFQLYADGLKDGAEDRGMMRVDRGDRGDFRSWVRARGRAIVDRDEWIDFAFSEQSDAGVQAEFFEREFLRYEERENYLHWRKADGADYTSARVRVRAGAFRNEVEELPSVGYSHGLTPLFDVGDQAVLYSASADIGRFTRREGSGGTLSPFDPVFDTSLGTRSLLRFDTRHRLEVPLRFASGGASAVPYLELAGTSWSEGVDPDQAPHRGALAAGLELSTTLWRRSEGGGVHTIAPFLAIAGDVLAERGEGDPIPLDSIEDPLPGDHLDLGVHSRWSDPQTGEAIDVSVFGRYARDSQTVLPLEVLTEYLGDVGGIPFALQHDGRYDLEAGETLYSRSAVGFQPLDDVGCELGFHRGKGTAGLELFEAATASARWRISPKWELGARQTISLGDSQQLASRLTLRRYGHDLILDMELSERLGEGGSSVSFSLSPVVGWTRDRLGVLDHWLATRR
jgi:hypothetical protein